MISHSNSINPHTQHVFELVHLVVFIILILYILIAFFIACVSIVIFKTWMRLESYKYGRISILNNNVDDVRKRYEELSNKRKHIPIRKLIHNIKLLWRLHRAYGDYQYHVIRKNFIHQHQLPDNFPFARYLKRCMKQIVSSMVEFHWSGLSLHCGLSC